MASYLEPKVLTFKATAAIGQYSVVKGGADNEHVSVSAAGATDKSVGIAMSAATVADQFTEVAVMGGGAKLKLAGTVAFGDKVTSNASGLGVVAASNDHVVGVAMEAGVSGDIIQIVVALSMLP